VLLRAGGHQVEYLDEEQSQTKEEYKTVSPFGQLPYLVDHKRNVTLAQSAAICVYAARVSKLDGGDDFAIYASALQYIELEYEICIGLGRALYTGAKGSKEREEAFVKAKKNSDARLGYVVKNLGSHKFLSGTHETPLADDYAVASLFWLLTLPSLYPDVATQFPELASHFQRVCKANPVAQQTFDEMSKWETYFTRH